MRFGCLLLVNIATATIATQLHGQLYSDTRRSQGIDRRREEKGYARSPSLLDIPLQQHSSDSNNQPPPETKQSRKSRTSMHFLTRSSSSWIIFPLFLTAFSPHFAHAADPATSSTAQGTATTTTIIRSDPARNTAQSMTTSSLSTTSPSSSSTTANRTTTAPPQTITVEVGKADHKFRPDVVQANIGDFIEFDFYPVNHSVVRAEYKYPCIPYEATEASKKGFFSGFYPVDAVLDNPPKYTIRINDTNPIFFYCSAPGSCINYAMVGVINPNSSVSLATHRQFARNSSYMLQPGESFPAESPSSTELPENSKVPSTNDHAGSSKLSNGAIAGITLACISVVALAAMLFFFWGRLKGLRDELNRKSSTVVRNAEPQSPVFYPWSEAPHLPPIPPQRNLSNMSSNSARADFGGAQRGVGLGISLAGDDNMEIGGSVNPSPQPRPPHVSPTFAYTPYSNSGASGNVDVSPALPPLPAQSSPSSSSPSPPLLSSNILNVSPTDHDPYHPSHHHNLYNHSPQPQEQQPNYRSNGQYLSPPTSPPPSYFPPTAAPSSPSFPFPSHEQKQQHHHQHMARSTSTRSHRSVGGVFDISPQTGTYTRASNSPLSPSRNHQHHYHYVPPPPPPHREIDEEGEDEDADANVQLDSFPVPPPLDTSTTPAAMKAPLTSMTASTASPFRFAYSPLSYQNQHPSPSSSSSSSSPPPPGSAKSQTVSPTDTAVGDGRNLQKVAVANQRRYVGSGGRADGHGERF